MAINVGQAVITVTANARPFARALQTQTRAIAASAARQGSMIGARIGEAMNKAAQKNVSGMNLALGGLLAALPLITSGASALAGALTAMAGSLTRALMSSASAVGVIGALATAAVVGRIAFSGMGEAIKGDEEALAKLNPQAREAAKAISGLQGPWETLQRAIAGKVFAGLGKQIEGLSVLLKPGGPIGQGLQGMGTELNRFFSDMLGFVQSDRFVSKFSEGLRGATSIFGTLRQAARPILVGIMNLFNALVPSGERLAQKIVDIAKAFRDWTQAEGFARRLDAYMREAANSMGVWWGLIKNVGRALWNVLNASAGAGDSLVASLSRAIGKFADWSSTLEGKSAIAGWAQQGVTAMQTLGSILVKVGAALGPLFNPAIFQGFLDLLVKMGPLFSAISGAISATLVPIFDKVGAALAENGPKIAAPFTALAPLLKGIGAIIGEVISQAIDIIGTVAAVLTPVIGIISNVLGPVLQKLAPIIAAVILGFGSLGFRLVSLAKYLGPVGKLFAAIVGPIVRLAGAIFSLIGKAIRPLMTVVGVVFRFIGRIIGSTIGFVGRIISTGFNLYLTVITKVLSAVWGIIRRVWSGIRTVIGTVVRVIATIIRTYFNVIRTVVTTVMNVIRAVISRVWNGIRSVISSVMRAVVNVVRASWNTVKSVTTSVWNGIKSVVGKVISGIRNTVTSGFTKIVSLVKGLPSRILSVAASFLNAGKELGSKVINGIFDGLRNMAGGIASIGTTVKNAINSALNLPVSIKGPGPLPDFTIPAFARGTNFAPGGVALVGEEGPELVTLPRGSKVATAAQTRARSGSLSGSGLPSKVTLRIGARDFVAYVEEIADDRIDAADSLVYQGA